MIREQKLGSLSCACLLSVIAQCSPCLHHLLVAELERTRVLIKQTETVPKFQETSLTAKSINI